MSNFYSMCQLFDVTKRLQYGAGEMRNDAGVGVSYENSRGVLKHLLLPELAVSYIYL